VGAITLDGKATRDEIFVDLKQRVAALTASGRTPGLGTILVGDDPGSQAYVRGKHADCAKVGITSIRRDLPADISTAELDETIDELNGNPECTGYIVQLPLPKHLNENAALERVDPAKPMSFSTFNGAIDVTLPADLKANVKIKTNHGDVFSDFDIKVTGYRPIMEKNNTPDGKFRLRTDQTINGEINGGGAEASFQTFNGRITLRKK